MGLLRGAHGTGAGPRCLEGAVGLCDTGAIPARNQRETARYHPRNRRETARYHRETTAKPRDITAKPPRNHTVCTVQTGYPRHRGDPGEHVSDRVHASGRPARGLLSIVRLTQYHVMLGPSPNPRGGTLSRHRRRKSVAADPWRATIWHSNEPSE